MAGLYVPLDVNYFDDDKLLMVPPMAELLYVRGLAFAKRTRTNGLLADRQLGVFGARIDHARRYAGLLVDCGLWDRNGEGWYIAAWLKRNTPVEDVSGIRADAGAIGAHNRWHVKRGRADPNCPHCVDAAGLR
jgi:hypothetical protein